MRTKEISTSLTTIQKACGDCFIRKACVFGGPAMQVMEMSQRNSQTDSEHKSIQAGVIVYVYDQNKIPDNCPTPGIVASAVDSLRPKQGRNSKRRP